MKTSSMPVSEAAWLIAELGARGLRLRPLPNGRIYVQPANLLDSRTADRIKAMREPIRNILSSSCGWSCSRCARFRFPLPAVCYWCRRAEEKPVHA